MSCTIPGLMSSVTLSSSSMTATCSPTPTWLAAMPIPGASRIVSSMSSSRRWSDASNCVTFLARSRRIGSSAVRMRRMTMPALYRCGGLEQRLRIDVDGNAGRAPARAQRRARLRSPRAARPGSASGRRGGRRRRAAARAPPTPRPRDRLGGLARPILCARSVRIGHQQACQHGRRRIAEQPSTARSSSSANAVHVHPRRGA